MAGTSGLSRRAGCWVSKAEYRIRVLEEKNNESEWLGYGVFPIAREFFDLVIHNMFELGKDS